MNLQQKIKEDMKLMVDSEVSEIMRRRYFIECGELLAQYVGSDFDDLWDEYLLNRKYVDDGK